MHGTVAAVAEDLAGIVRDFRDDKVDAQVFAEALSQGWLCCRRDDEVGFQAIGNWIPMYTSLAVMRAHEGHVPWFAGPGGTLLRLVPDDYGVILDLGADSQLILSRPAEDSGNETDLTAVASDSERRTVAHAFPV